MENTCPEAEDLSFRTAPKQMDNFQVSQLMVTVQVRS